MANSSTSIAEFVLHCAVASEQKSLIIAVVSFIYITTFLGNTLVILVIISNHQLQTPMFFYICALAAIDLVTCNTLIPRILTVMIFNFFPVPYGACILQVFVASHLQVLLTLHLTLMAIDRYIAVVHPLQYPALVTNKTVLTGFIISNLISAAIIIPLAVFATELHFCQTNVLPYCTCDISTMIHISCADDPKYLQYVSSCSFVLGVGPLVLILSSYGRIVQEALQISSVEGKKKVFSTCVTHLLVVGTFYVPIVLSNTLPGLGIPLPTEIYNTMDMIGIIIPPMMNPIIYSFRNNEIKSGIYKLFKAMKTSPDAGRSEKSQN